MRRKKLFGGAGIFVLLLILAGAGAMAWWRWAEGPAGTGEAVNFVVQPGANTTQVSEALADDHLVRSAWFFRTLAKSLNADSQLMPGEYMISAAMTPREIIDILTVPQQAESVTVTIPEGYTVKQIIDVLVEKGFSNQEELTRVTTEDSFPYDFLSAAPSGIYRLEGYLFPDTYFFEKDISPHDLIDTLLQRFSQELTPDTLALLEQSDLSIHEWVTLASLVEEEAVKQEDRPLIASVIFNRLAIKMPLQIDATVQFLLPAPKEVLLYEDLEIDSPYNTYRNPGLPPGPIASPGHASLQAMLNPEKTDYLYYLAKGDGYHVFAKTYQEHLNNQAKYLK